MLLVRTYLAPSPIQGIGLFAAEPLAKGTEIWKFVAGFDLTLAKSAAGRFPAVAREFLEHYAYYQEAAGGYVLMADDARFFNHADAPNTIGKDKSTIAARDIAAGEELTCNYFEFDEEAPIKLR